MDIRKQQIRTIYPSDPTIINSAVTNFANLATSTLYIKDADGTTYLPVGSSIAERYINDFLTSSFLPSANISTDLYNWHNFRADLEFLNKKLSTLRKTITSWDTYHIAEVATNRNTLVNKLATLAPNTGLLINITPSIEISGVNYGQGDVVYCDFNGEKHHIKGASGGYYYPQDFTTVDGANNTFKMVYRFASTLPTGGSEEMGANATPHEIMEKQIKMSSGHSVYFGQYNLAKHGESGNAITKNFIIDEDNNNVLIYPIIRIYIAADGGLEEVLYTKDWVNYNTTAKTFTITNQMKTAVIVEMR